MAHAVGTRAGATLDIDDAMPRDAAAIGKCVEGVADEAGVVAFFPDFGLVAADQLNPQKSRVLLQLCIARGMDGKRVQDAFYRY